MLCAAGEHEAHQVFVFIHNNVLVRVDVCIWRYNFSSSQVISGLDNVMAYLTCMSVVDHTKVSKELGSVRDITLEWTLATPCFGAKELLCARPVTTSTRTFSLQ